MKVENAALPHWTSLNALFKCNCLFFWTENFQLKQLSLHWLPLIVVTFEVLFVGWISHCSTYEIIRSKENRNPSPPDHMAMTPEVAFNGIWYKFINNIGLSKLELNNKVKKTLAKKWFKASKLIRNIPTPNIIVIMRSCYRNFVYCSVKEKIFPRGIAWTPWFVYFSVISRTV